MYSILTITLLSMYLTFSSMHVFVFTLHLGTKKLRLLGALLNQKASFSPLKTEHTYLKKIHLDNTVGKWKASTFFHEFASYRKNKRGTLARPHGAKLEKEKSVQL